MPGTTLFGLGSAHGDDQVGWLIVDAIAAEAETLTAPVTVRHLKSPIDLVHDLEGCDRVVICDACRTESPLGTLHRWEWPTSEIAATRAAGSHDFSLPDTFNLAAQLGRLPQAVVVWGIDGVNFSGGAEMSPELRNLIPQLARQIFFRDIVTSPRPAEPMRCHDA